MARFQPFNVSTSQRVANIQASPQVQTGGTIAAVNQARGGIEALSQRLESFSKQAFQMSAQQVQAQGIREATIDIQKRKQKISKIRQDVADPFQQQEQINSLLEGKLQEDITVYGKAYNTAANSA